MKHLAEPPGLRTGQKRKATALLTTEAARYLQIERAMRAGKATRVVLMAECNCSRPTLVRALKTMREELGAPIFYDNFLGRYRLSSRWPGVHAALFEDLDASASMSTYAEQKPACGATARMNSPEPTPVEAT